MFIANEQHRIGWYLLILATIVHLLSYFTPMEWSGGETWGEIYWIEILPSLGEWRRWKQGWYIILALCVPLLTLLYTGFRFLLNTQKLPRLATLVIGFLLPNSIIPIMVVYLNYVGDNSENRLLGYLVWNASFWLYFLGFWWYKREEKPMVNDLSDHLIDEE